MSTQQQSVQIELFSRGNLVPSIVAQAARIVTSYKKKDKAFVLNSKGEKIETTKVIKLMPRKSSENPDLADLTGKTGQGLIAFEAEARHELLQSGFAHMSRLVASGNYTFDTSRVNVQSGKFVLAIKPAFGKAPALTAEQLAEQAKALGYTLVPQTPTPEPEAPDEVENNGAAVVVETKASKKAAKAVKAAVAA